MRKKELESSEPPARLVPLDSLDDLKRVLFIQKTLAQEIRRELMSLTTPADLAKGQVSGPEELRRMISSQASLLDKYASYPTLTEFVLHSSLAGATKWGATFGVAILVKALILDHVKANMPQLAQFVRPMYLVILGELNEPKHQYLIDPLEKAFKFQVSAEGGDKVPEDQQKAFKRKLLYQLTERLIGASVQYGVIEPAPIGFCISDLGRRVLLHLIDADTFLNELAEAHKRFQSSLPQLHLV